MNLLRILIIALSLSVFFPSEGKKIKTTMKVDKKGTKASKKNNKTDNGQNNQDEIFIVISCEEQPEYCDSISFSGYEKEANSSIETVLISNQSDSEIISVEMKVDYLDMKGRLLHSRTITEDQVIPAHETRRVDFKSWDKQKSYYYYLCNEPRKVATPYKVTIRPLKLVFSL